jgi:hypothetical protein
MGQAAVKAQRRLTRQDTSATVIFNAKLAWKLVSQVQRRPKIPKGTRDLLPDQMAIRELAFRTCASVRSMLRNEHQPAGLGLWLLEQMRFPNACPALTLLGSVRLQVLRRR